MKSEAVPRGWNSNRQKVKEGITELIQNSLFSRTFYNNRMTNEQLRQLLQVFVDKPVVNMQPSIFTGVEGKDMLSCLNKFELIVANNN